jgi:hypothetical protein
LGDPLKGNLLLLYKPLHLEAQQVSTRIEVRRHQLVDRDAANVARAGRGGGCFIVSLLFNYETKKKLIVM